MLFTRPVKLYHNRIAAVAKTTTTTKRRVSLYSEPDAESEKKAGQLEKDAVLLK